MNPVKGQQVVTAFGNLISIPYIKENYSYCSLNTDKNGRKMDA